MQVMYRFSEFYEDVLKLCSVNTPLEVATLNKIFKSRKIKSVLDIACGVGRHSVELAKLGYEVAGLDFSPSQIKQAKEKAKENKVKVNFYIKNANTFNLKQRFDAAICMWSTISEEPMLYEKVIANAYRTLNKNGIFVVDIKNWKVVDRKKGVREEVYKRNRLVLKRKMWDIFTENYRIRQAILEYNGKKYDEICLTRLLSPKELIGEMKKAGFKGFEVWGDYTTKKVDNPKRFLVIASK